MSSLGDEAEWWGGHNEERGATIVTGRKAKPVESVLGGYKGNNHKARHPPYIYDMFIRVGYDTETRSITNANAAIKRRSQDLRATQ